MSLMCEPMRFDNAVGIEPMKGMRKMHMRKRALAGLALLLGIMLIGSGCETRKLAKGADAETAAPLRVVTTIFPPFDFARQIAGGHAKISMLLKPGMESHSYEPSPADIISVESCDLFIYNGGESDTWVDDLLNTIDTSNLHVLKMMDCVDTLEEQAVEGMQGAHDHGHDHEAGHVHDEEGAVAEYDEHVWTSPRNACAITEAIAAQMARLDPGNAQYYKANTAAYIQELEELDQTFMDITAAAKRHLILFGDRFPFRYFADAYGLSYRAAFPGCSAESEPSVKTVAYLIDKAREEEIPNIFYIEFSNQKIAQTLQEETGAVPLLFHSCHNLSKDEMERGTTYLELMRGNAENLKEALN